MQVVIITGLQRASCVKLPGSPLKNCLREIDIGLGVQGAEVVFLHVQHEILAPFGAIT